MKKINSIDYAPKVIGSGLVFLAAIPAGLYILNCFQRWEWLRMMIYASASVGVIIESAFTVLVAVELWQDRLNNEYYLHNPTSMKTPQQILDERRRVGRR